MTALHPCPVLQPPLSFANPVTVAVVERFGFDYVWVAHDSRRLSCVSDVLQNLMRKEAALPILSSFVRLLQIGYRSSQARRRHRSEGNGLAVELGPILRRTTDKRITVRCRSSAGLLGSIPAWHIGVLSERLLADDIQRQSVITYKLPAPLGLADLAWLLAAGRCHYQRWRAPACTEWRRLCRYGFRQASSMVCDER
jgi:hypothetical protein